MFRVGFYFGESQGEPGGVTTYADRLWNELREAIPMDGIELSEVHSILRKDVCFPTRLLGSSTAKRVRDAWRILSRNGPLLDRLMPKVKPAVRKKFDLLHVPFQVTPTFDLPYVCTMHDVQELHFPQYFTADARRWRATEYHRSLERAKRVVVSFDHVKHDIVRFFGIQESKVHVIPLPSATCQPKSGNEESQLQAAEKYGSLGPFLLYPAQTWEHKNHLGLISGFERAASKLGSTVQLVCTGKKNEYFPTIERRLKNSPIADRIHFVGMVSETELYWFYRRAIAVVVPTLYEAGSLPVIEAMSLEVPVICSNATSLPSTIGSPDFVFDPADLNDMVLKMIKIACDDAFRNRSKENGKLQYQRLAKQKVASLYHLLWTEIAKELDRTA